ncbi:MAG: hypothetical protein H6858_03480 [Rhodospirillales bacterium]|nr:hypothetical protein [Alphaproteobacteria bacterium]MCB1841207.1 hypothetical protein [Alphaproteobacteria bacterium]MCB9976645.1 hypothetical protein [Rhodospirillales bacterium]
MSLSFLAPSRTVLLITDDALFIYSVGPRGVRLIDTVPWTVDNFEANVAAIISKECGGKPVLILNDMVEQHYRKERIPKVSVMDKANVVQRKLMVAFPNYPVRAALPLKEKAGKGDKALPGSVYIFAAVPDTDPFKKTMGAARRSLAPIAGFCLLPVEAAGMIKALSKKLTKGKDKAKWTVFVGQHQNGGLRQVVVKNGELALTRMTPIVDTDDDAAKWVSDVAQEFKATMSYLGRFGYDVSDGLNIILISNPAVGEMMEEALDIPCNYYNLTTQDAAQLLNMPLGRQDSLGYADILHIAWSGRKATFALPMKAKEIDKVSRPRQIAVLASFLLLLGGLFQGYQLFSSYSVVSQNQEGVDDETSKKAQLDLQFTKEVKRKEDLGFDITLIQSALAVHNELELKRIKILQLFYYIGLSLGTELRFDSIEIERGKPDIISKWATQTSKTPLFVAVLRMTFPSTTDPEKGNKEVQDLQARLQTVLPDHIVKVTKKLEDYEYVDSIVVQTGDAEKEAKSADFVAEIKIEGPEI